MTCIRSRTFEFKIIDCQSVLGCQTAILQIEFARLATTIVRLEIISRALALYSSRSSEGVQCAQSSFFSLKLKNS
jgi:hypothetical protein